MSAEDERIEEIIRKIREQKNQAAGRPSESTFHTPFDTVEEPPIPEAAEPVTERTALDQEFGFVPGDDTEEPDPAAGEVIPTAGGSGNLQIQCPHCHSMISASIESLEAGRFACPVCGEYIAFDLGDDGTDLGDGTMEADVDFVSAADDDYGSDEPEFIAPEGYPLHGATDVEFNEVRTKKRGFFSSKRNRLLAVCALFLVIAVCIFIGLASGCERRSESTADPSASDSEDGTSEEMDPEEEAAMEAILLPSSDKGTAYLDNTLFVGDSNTVRISYMGVLSLEQTAGIVGIGIDEIETDNGVYFYELANPVTINKAVEYMQPGRIILSFGTNDTKLSNSKFIMYYRSEIQKLQSLVPDADIIVSSIFPVTRNNKYDVSQKRIDEMNTALLKLCAEMGIPFLNVREVLTNTATGYVKDEYISADGIHLNPAGLKMYVKYARTHALTGGTERASNNSKYTRKEAPYTYFSDDEEEPLQMDKVISLISQYARNDKYAIWDSTQELRDNPRYTYTTVKYAVAEADNVAGNEEDVAAAAYYKAKGKTAMYLLPYFEKDSSTGNVEIYIALINCNHNYKDGVCEYCGEEDPDYTPEAEHQHDYVWASLGNGYHIQKCSCGETSGDQEACSDGNSDGKCDKCGYQLSSGEPDPPPHTHSYGAPVSNGSGSHTYTCSGCGESYSEPCDGAYPGTCSKCGYTWPDSGSGSSQDNQEP